MKFVNMAFPEVWPSLANGTIDISADGVTVTMSRDAYGVRSRFQRLCRDWILRVPHPP